jgi:hypothetical protein
MTSLPELAFPSNRTLADWWKHLAPLQPRALWAAHLLLHRVEAMVKVQKPAAVDPFAHHVLKVLAIVEPASREALEAGFPERSPLSFQVLRTLQAEDLISCSTTGSWSMTPRGRHALQQGITLHVENLRRGFCFVESENVSHVPEFLPLQNHATLLSLPATAHRPFPVHLLDQCLAQPAAWKMRRGFPLEVTEVLKAHSEVAASCTPQPAWQRIIVDHPRRLLVLVILAPGPNGSDKLLGFGIQPERWILHHAEPAFAAGSDWREILPDFASEVSTESWAAAWKAFCRSLNPPIADTESAVQGKTGLRLTIKVSRQFMDWLRASRSDLLRGEGWLLAGSGRTRAAAVIKLI